MTSRISGIRVGYDLSILRHPHAGTARYARELLDAMRGAASPDDVVVTSLGFRRGRRGTRVRRYANLAGDLTWWTLGIPVVAARHNVDAWFGPANILPVALPRPCVATIHDANFLVRPEDFDSGYRRYAHVMFSHAAQRAQVILADSKFAATELVTRLGAPPDRIRVGYPGLDHVFRIAPRAPAGVPDRYALFVGQTEPHKNIGLLIEAWAAGVPNGLHLVITGQAGRDDARLRSLAAENPRHQDIHFLGRVDDATLAGLYGRAACFLMPSRAEGFGFPPLEAMGRGIPTAVANAASLPEVTDGGALVFDPDDAVALAAIISTLSDDVELRDRLGARGREVAARYKWEATARVAWDAVREALERG